MTSDYVVVPREPTEAMLHSARPMPLGQLDGIWQAMVSAAPSTWRPISEAPDDAVVLTRTKHGTSVARWSKAKQAWFVVNDEGVYLRDFDGDLAEVSPTHFMLLPAPPSNPT